jgi:alpha-L-rhamnosidase
VRLARLQRGGQPRLVVLASTLVVGALVASSTNPAHGAPPNPLAEPAAFADPPRELRPKFRWWWGDWTGSTPLDQSLLAEEVAAFARAGFGGFEIAFSTPTWGNAEQRRALATVLAAARRDGLGVDVTLGEGWPLRTPNTARGTGLSEQELIYGREDLQGTRMYSGPAPPPIDDSTNARRGTLLAVTVARVLKRGPPVTVAGRPPPRSTILDPESFVDLTSRLTANGMVKWRVPRGDWILFSFWKRDASEGVIDHLSARAARAAAQYIDRNQIGEAAAGLRGNGGSFFEDSLELSPRQLFWTHNFPREFRKRRGYDMTKYLPLMFVQGMHQFRVPDEEPMPDFELPRENGLRYRHDYYETLTDLYVDNHIDVLGTWAKSHRMRLRAQVAYGNTFEVVRSAREITRRGGLADDESLGAGDDYPFDRTNVDWRFALNHYRAVAGGAHQGGENQIGSELGAVFVRELMMSLDEYKRAMDKAWAAGLTVPVVHGYSPPTQDATWPGASRFAGLVGDSWNHRTFPQWAMWKPLADYWGRGALVLHQGRARTDVAIYRDGFVTTAARIPPAPPPRRAFFNTVELERAGFTLEYVDPVGLREPAARGKGVLYPKGPAYRAVVIDERWVPGATAAALDRASSRGMRVVVVGSPPRRANGAEKATAQDGRVRAAFRRIMRRDTTRHVGAQGGVLEALRDLELRPAAAWSRALPVYSQHREVGETDLFYLWNSAYRATRFTGSFRAVGSPSRLDLWTGAIEPVAAYRSAGSRIRVPLVLGPGETTVLAFRRERASRAHVTSASAGEVVLRGDDVEVRSREGGTSTLRLSNGSTRKIPVPRVPGPIALTDWRLHVAAVGPEGMTEHDVALDRLGDWRAITQISTESGTGTYTTRVRLPDGWTDADRGTLLDLGRMKGAVQVYVNDRLATPDIRPREPIDISRLLREGGNDVRVVLTTTLKNKAMSALPVILKSRFAFPSQPGTQTYGLLGPVRLVPYGRGATRLPRRRVIP